MKNPYTDEKIKSIYANIPDAKLSKRKSAYIVIACICLFGAYTIPVSAVLFWRVYLISKEITRRNKDKPRAGVAPSPASNNHSTDPDAPRYSFSDGTEILLSDVIPSAFVIVKSFHTKVVGVSFENDNGTSRQEYLEYSYPGEKLMMREFEYEGKPAYAVFTEKREQIGNVSESLSADISDIVDSEDREIMVYGEITEITGGDDGKKYGCNIIIYLLARR